MSDVNFEEEAVAAARPKQEQGLYKLAISLGLAKDGESARLVLIVISIVCLILAVAVPLIF